MCGIAGIAGRSDEPLVRAMCARIAHRGPDDEGFYSTGQVTLGQRRLSIIDLVTGQQPLSNEDGTVWITFNGEVYNYQSLRADLEAKGHRFKTNSDTETIVHAYEQYGEACVEKLYGMFAFAIWDEKTRTLFAARDHAGVKPFYYAEVGDCLVFGSEIKAVLADPSVPRDIDYFALDDYFTYLYTVPPRTIFKSVRQLPPAHSLTWKDGKLSVRRYWTLRVAPEHRTEEEWVEILHPLLEEVIRENMIADVPLGAFLSGGLDSSTIVALMAKSSSMPVRTFTIGFDKDGNLYDEIGPAKVVADAFKTDHHVLRAEGGIVGLLPTIVRHFDEPFGNPTALLAYILSKLTRQHVTVALAGDGGDETFGGYARYAGAKVSGAYRMVPDPIRRYMIHPLVSLLPESTRGLHLLRRIREFSGGSLHNPVEMYTEWIGYYTAAERAALYAGDLRKETQGYDSRDFIRGLFRECETGDFVAQTMYVDLHSFLPHNLLQYSDRMSMAHALEIRVPFTDPRVMEATARIPSALKIRGMQTKHMMRKTMERDLPRQILARKKLGFNPPMGTWITTSLRGVVEEFLSDDAIRRRGYFRPEAVRGMLRAHGDGRRDFTWHIWSLIFFEQWHRLYMDGQA